MIRYSIGVIGAGVISRTMHLPVLKCLPDVRIAWVIDSNEDQARAVAKSFRIPFARLPRSLSDLPPCDVALLAIPVGVRGPYYEEFASRGSAVFAEKPFATDLESHIKYSKIFDSNKVACGYMRRLFSSTMLLGRLIEEEWFGPLRGLRISEGGQATKTGVDHSHYEDVRMAGGGLLMSVGCHGLDLALHVTRATSFDVLDAELEMDGGIDRKATAKVKLSSARLESRRECLLDFCVSNLDVQDNVVEFDFPNVVVSASNGPQGGVSVRSKETKSSAMIEDKNIRGARTLNQAFYLEWESFLRGLAGGYPSLISAASSSLTAALIDDLYSLKGSSVVGHRA